MSKTDPLHRHEGEEQTRHMLWARVHELKGEGYTVSEIAYLTGNDEEKVRHLLVTPKPKRK